MARDLTDIALEIKGASSTLCILSGMVSDTEGKFKDEIISNSIYSVSLQLDRLSEEIEKLTFHRPKNRLKELREAKGISLDELAENSGISEDILRSIEEGKETVLNTRKIAKLSEILDAQPSEIFII